MVGFGVAVLVLAAAVIAIGLVLYGNGAGSVPDRPLRDTTAARRGLGRIAWSDLFSTMKTSVRVAASSDADQADRKAAMGAFLVLAGLILVVFALLAFLAAVV